jgi:LuxR family maltose regulon positive regulatory protein
MTTVLPTKLTIPNIRPLPVVRRHLMEQLEAIYQRRFAIISAPAGFGKTTLIAHYAQEVRANGRSSLAWLTLEKNENDPARFLTYFIAGLAYAGFLPPSDEAEIRQMPFNQAILTIINALPAQISQTSTNGILYILDDYHLIQNKEIHEGIVYLLEHLPPHHHFIFVSRADPPFPLARWRARGELLEMRMGDLRFSEAETNEFYQKTLDIPLSDHAITVLRQRTEGWIVGLQLAAVSLQGRRDVDEFLRQFSGSHRFILDYLMEEVLARQPEVLHTFLLQTAVLDRMCASLCSSLLSISLDDAQKTLQQLEAANLFLVPLDDERRWYRYHHLFADLLQQRLQQTRPQVVPYLHRLASDWFAAHGFAHEAVIHALHAGDAALAADLITQIADELLMRSELVTVKRWLAMLPAAERTKRPSLSLYYAWALIMDGRAESEIETALESVVSEGAPGELELVQSLQAIFQGHGQTAIALAQQALDNLAAKSTFMRGVATWILGVSQLFVGELETGLQTLEVAVTSSRQAGNLAMAVASLGRMADQAWRGGDLYRAQRIYRQAIALASDEEEQPLPIAGETMIGMARLYYAWNDLPAARLYLLDGIALTERWREVAAATGYIWLSHIDAAQGQAASARAAIKRAGELARTSSGTELDDLAVAIGETRLNLKQGNLQAALAWVAERSLSETIDETALRQQDDIIEGHLRKYEYLLLARIRLAQKLPAAALTLLKPLLLNAQRLKRIDLEVEIHVLTALAYWQLQETQPADRHLRNALKLGLKGGHLRIFVDAGSDIGTLLERQQPDSEAQQAYLQEVRLACGLAPFDPPAAARQPLIEPLSERELEVLKLIAAGLSNREIGQELVISLPTVKWHTSNIYGKLNVSNRTTAVARARKLTILA